MSLRVHAFKDVSSPRQHFLLKKYILFKVFANRMVLIQEAIEDGGYLLKIAVRIVQTRDKRLI
jgi:hypothetical protein